MKRILSFSAILALTGVLHVGADEWRLWQNEASSSYAANASISNAHYWVGISDSQKHSGGPGEPLSSAENYKIQGGYSVYTPAAADRAGGFAFTGGKLTLGTASNEGRIRHRLSQEAAMDWDNGGANAGLVLVNGYYLSYFSGAGQTHADIYGKIRVESGRETPFRFGFSSAGRRMNFYGNFSSEDSSVSVRFAGLNYITSNSDKRVAGSSFGLFGDWSGYFGNVEVTNTVVSFGNTVMPGRIIVDGTSVLTVSSANDTFTVGSLSMAANSRLAVKTDIEDGRCGMIAVTNELRLSAPVILMIDADCYAGYTGVKRLPVLKFPATTDLAVDDFVIDATNATAVAGTCLKLQDNLDGTVTLYALLVPTIVEQTVSDENVRDVNSNYTSSFDNKDHWSDGNTPHDGAQYLVKKIDSSVTKLRTPVDSARDYKFPGERLTIDEGCQFGLFYKSLEVDELIMRNNSLFMLGSGVRSGRLSGRLVVPDGIVSLCAYNTAAFEIAADISGAGCLVFDGSHDNTGTRRATVSLTGNNSRFTGSITVGLNRDQQTVANNQYQTLSVAAPAKLGAPLASFNPTALVLKRLARLSAVGSVAFEDETRGIYIGEDGSKTGAGGSDVNGTGSEGQLSVEAGHTLTIRSQLTLNGRLHKYGAGTLALGGPLRFGPAALISETPVAGSNYCAVAEGCIKPLVADAFNGMEISFAAGTGIKLDLNQENGDLRMYGLRNNLATAPFTAEGRIPVTFDAPEGFEPQLPFSLGVVTVAADKVETVRSLLEIRRPSLEYQMVSGIVPRDGGLATVVVEFKKVGFVLSIR